MFHETRNTFLFVTSFDGFDRERETYFFFGLYTVENGLYMCDRSNVFESRKSTKDFLKDFFFYDDLTSPSSNKDHQCEKCR